MMLDGKSVAITGANGALGRATTDVALQHGASVIAIDLHFDAATQGVQQLILDLADLSAVESAVAKIEGVDALFNIAGGFAMGPAVHQTSQTEWDAMFSMNVTTMRNMSTAVVPKMKAAGRGSIVNIGALSAREGQSNMGAYCVAKSAVMRLTESLSRELRAQGVNVNAVLPSIIDTPTNRADMPDADFAKWVHPQDLAEVICFLGSDRASAVHGALVPVTGLS